MTTTDDGPSVSLPDDLPEHWRRIVVTNLAHAINLIDNAAGALTTHFKKAGQLDTPMIARILPHACDVRAHLWLEDHWRTLMRTMAGSAVRFHHGYAPETGLPEIEKETTRVAGILWDAALEYGTKVDTAKNGYPPQLFPLVVSCDDGTIDLFRYTVLSPLDLSAMSAAIVTTPQIVFQSPSHLTM